MKKLLLILLVTCIGIGSQAQTIPEVEKMILHQNGQDIPGKKIN